MSVISISKLKYAICSRSNDNAIIKQPTATNSDSKWKEELKLDAVFVFLILIRLVGITYETSEPPLIPLSAFFFVTKFRSKLGLFWNLFCTKMAMATAMMFKEHAG